MSYSKEILAPIIPQIDYSSDFSIQIFNEPIQLLNIGPLEQTYFLLSLLRILYLVELTIFIISFIYREKFIIFVYRLISRIKIKKFDRGYIQFTNRIYKKLEKHYLIALVFFSILTIFLTYPYVFVIFDRIPMGVNAEKPIEFSPSEKYDWKYFNDGLYHIFYIWWFKKALIDLKTNPFFCPYVFAGIYNSSNTFLSTISPLQGLLSVPFTFISNNPIFAYNAVILLSFVFSAMAMYSLIFYLTKNRIAGLFSGVAFAFCGHRIVFMSSGAFNLLGTYFIPLIILFFIKIFRENKLKNAFIFSFLLFLQFLTDFQYMYFTLLLLFLLSLFEFFIEKKFNFEKVKHVLYAFILFFLLSSYPLFIARNVLIEEKVPSGFSISDASGLSSTTTAFFYKISPGMKLTPDTFGVAISSEYLGIVLIILSIISFFLFYKNKEIIFWGFIAILFMILSMGTFSNAWILHYTKILDIPLKDLSLFTFLWNNMPYFSFLRGPSRFSIITLISLCIISSIFYTTLIKKIKFKSKDLIGIIILILVILDFTVAPISTIKPILTQKAYLWLKEQPGDFTILEYPLFSHAHVVNKLYLIHIPIHEKKIVNGYSTLISSKYQSILPVLNNITSNEAYELLKKYHVKYVLVHPYLINLTNEIETPGYLDIKNFLDSINHNPNITSSNLTLIKIFDDTIVYEVK
ncbi:MAG: hypothetical protein OH319_00245 [Candidatus Parvarchaeota archaeon]|nr:hypothetical protein [Candidatus Jingweiarchaeum tengchongense]